MHLYYVSYVMTTKPSLYSPFPDSHTDAVRHESNQAAQRVAWRRLWEILLSGPENTQDSDPDTLAQSSSDTGSRAPASEAKH